MTKAVQKWADVAMFTAEPIDVAKGPTVELLSCNNDPLGTIASVAKIYKGESVPSLAHITDDERRFYLADVRKNVLSAPLEFVNFHFLISGVTRGFTHQMVRQRTATYGQESMRFAVKETMPVGYPPSLNGTVSWEDWLTARTRELFPMWDGNGGSLTERQSEMAWAFAYDQAPKEQLWRKEWDNCVERISVGYNDLVNSGMPAEDARGLAPTNVLTTINYNTSLRGLSEHAGLRLCTQAQFEWRLVWAKMLQAIRDYGKTVSYQQTVASPEETVAGFANGEHYANYSSAWQFDELASIFKPICYKTGKCEFMSEGDRFCSIRERVQANHKIGRPSSEWGDTMQIKPGHGIPDTWIRGINDEEWMMDPNAARVGQ